MFAVGKVSFCRQRGMIKDDPARIGQAQHGRHAKVLAVVEPCRQFRLAPAAHVIVFFEQDCLGVAVMAADRLDSGQYAVADYARIVGWEQVVEVDHPVR